MFFFDAFCSTESIDHFLTKELLNGLAYGKIRAAISSVWDFFDS